MNNICFNERPNLWTTRYDWTPLISENIHGKFYSIGGMDSDSYNNAIWIHSPNEYVPTKWYNKQHVFEFEFVVSEPLGVSKIFDNLQTFSHYWSLKKRDIHRIRLKYSMYVYQKPEALYMT